MSYVASVKLSQVLKDIREMEDYDVYHTAKRCRTDVSSNETSSLVHVSSDQDCTINKNTLHDDQQIFINFLFTQMHTDDIQTNVTVQAGVKIAAYKIVEKKYCRKYNCDPFPNKSPLHYQHDYDEQVLLGDDACHHHLIADIIKLSRILENLYQVEIYKLNYFVFVPYLKQLLAITNLFVNDACCKKSIRLAKDVLEVALKRGQEQLTCVQRINKTVQVMNVFFERPLYECGICGETSIDITFLKPNECCGFKICNACFANLWKFSNTTVNPVCPVCRTSYRSDQNKLTTSQQSVLLNN
ncbi:AC141-like protein [Alphabaculovirus altermyunipunctae]|jgi:hypothetical protein|uniref:AC141-like protein n=1 Tax=Mythimna unipuncta nucleopolyhedrovirus TaxID=447897 RepID=A0A346TPE4_9ABAC|nr:AC141-like protein [Mythimna unipuncta nucleopolyhedrovirus]AXU41454.1 AC141-like protein [Mythimna unipuncta nucleopolyhedrovirus]